MPTRDVETMLVKPKSGGGVYPDGSPVLPKVHFEGSKRRTIPADGADVPITSYYLRKVHSGDLEIVAKVPAAGYVTSTLDEEK